MKKQIGKWELCVWFSFHGWKGVIWGWKQTN